MDEDRGKELLIAPPPEGDGMSHATSKYRYARRFRTAGERRTDMQEILFSAKRIDNGYTVCGYHVKDGVTGKHFIVAEGTMLHESDKVGEEGLLNFVAFEVDEDTISVTGDGWIPVDEVLPEDDVEVLVTYADIDDEQYTGIAITTYGYAYLGGNKLDFKEWRSPFEYFRSNYKIIAWRPLPEPYRPKKESEGSRRLREREEFFKG